MAEQEQGQTRPFADVLLELSKGRVHNDASFALQDLVAAVADTGKKGSLSLVITVTPSKADGQVEVTAEVKTKPPTPKPATSLFFVTDDHNLSRENPEQPHLPLREVPTETERLREADSK